MRWVPYPSKILDEAMSALTLPDPQQNEKGFFRHGWVSYVGWVCGTAVLLAYVVRPMVAIFCSIYFPRVLVPEVPLNSMWPPVLMILGAGGTRVGNNLVRLREARKSQETTLKVCAECPTRDCAVCPLKSLRDERTSEPPRPLRQSIMAHQAPQAQLGIGESPNYYGHEPPS
jgi:hypothetical protein